MSVRRGPFKLKVEPPVDDEDSDTGSERVVSRDDANDSDTSSDGSFRDGQIEAKPSQRSVSSSSSYDSNDEHSDVEEKQSAHNDNSVSSSDSSNSGVSDMEEKQSAQNDNSTSSSDSSSNGDNDIEEKQSAHNNSGSTSDSSNDGDSDVEAKQSAQNDSSASSSDRSNDEDSDLEVKRNSQSDNSASSSHSSSDEDSDLDEKQSAHDDKEGGNSSSSDSSRSGGSGEDSSASDPDSSESEESESEGKLQPGKTKKSPQKVVKTSPLKVEPKKASVAKKRAANTSTKSGHKVLKRLKRSGRNSGEDRSDEDSSDEDSSDEDSGVTVAQPPASKKSVNEEEEDDNTESEREVEENGLGSDSDEDWQLQDKKEDEGGAKARRKRDDTVGDSDEEWFEELEEEKMRPRFLTPERRKGINDLNQARQLMRNITSHVPLMEETAIRRGVKLSGPPLEFATTHLDEYARKFRWPQHFRNLRNRDFSQDPSDILEDHELLSEVRQPESESSEEGPPKESPFAQVPRPVVSMAAQALRRSLRKRSSDHEGPRVHAPSAVALLNIARVGGQFGDHFVESLLSANGKALQGIIDNYRDYDKRCWSTLPTKKKPIANWRFVLEHVRRTMGRSDHDDSVYPPMKQETLERITKRLKTLYGYTAQHEEYDVFAEPSPDTSNNSADVEE